MKFIGLVLKSARRSKRRTALTMMSVAIAVFLFASLRAVLDGFDAGVGRQLLDAHRDDPLDVDDLQMPTSHAEVIKSTPGVQDVTWANWFGGIYKDPKNFFGQFAIEPESYLRMYPGDPPDAGGEARRFSRIAPAASSATAWRRSYGFKVGDKIDAAGRAFRSTARRTSTSPSAASTAPAARRRQPVDDVPLEVRRRAVDREGADRLVRRRRSAIPIAPRRWRSAIDQKFANSPYETKTDTEQAFSALVRLDVRQPEPAARQRRARGRASRRCSSPATRWRCRCASGRPRSP